MSALCLSLPESIHRHMDELALREGVSVDQFVVAAIVEKVSAIATDDYLQARANRADAEAFKSILAKTPDRDPIPGDAL